MYANLTKKKRKEEEIESKNKRQSGGRQKEEIETNYPAFHNVLPCKDCIYEKSTYTLRVGIITRHDRVVYIEESHKATPTYQTIIARKPFKAPEYQNRIRLNQSPAPHNGPENHERRVTGARSAGCESRQGESTPSWRWLVAATPGPRSRSGRGINEL